MPVRVWNEKDVASFNFSVLPGNVGKAREGNEVHEVLAVDRAPGLRHSPAGAALQAAQCPVELGMCREPCRHQGAPGANICAP